MNLHTCQHHCNTSIAFVKQGWMRMTSIPPPYLVPLIIPQMARILLAPYLTYASPPPAWARCLLINTSRMKTWRGPPDGVGSSYIVPTHWGLQRRGGPHRSPNSFSSFSHPCPFASIPLQTNKAAGRGSQLIIALPPSLRFLASVSRRCLRSRCC